MKKILLTQLFCCLVYLCSAQSTIAKLKYEEAEESFVSGNYSNTITKLDEAEKLLGKTNPKVLYLRIMAQSKMVDHKKATGIAESDFALVNSMLKNMDAYLKNYESVDGIEEKYREIYKLSNAFASFPRNESLFKSFVSKMNEERIAKMARPKNVFDSLCKVYKYKRDLTEAEFRQYNPEAAAIMQKKQSMKDKDGGITYVHAYAFGPSFIAIKNGRINRYSHAIKYSRSKEELYAFYDQYNKILSESLEGSEVSKFEHADSKSMSYKIKDAQSTLTLSCIPILYTVSLDFQPLE